MNATIDAFIDRVEHLPPSPRVLVRLIEMFKDPQMDVDEVVKLLSHDPSFTAEVLKRCNSAYFGNARPAEDMFEAVSRLGFQEIYHIVLAMFAATAILRPEVGGNLHVEILWRHSVAVAVAAGVLAKAAGESGPVAFTAGLLHEVGKVIMVSSDKDLYTQAIQNAALFKRAVILTEKELFGFDHAELGAGLLARWNLPPNIVAAVLHHHDLSGGGPFERLAATVHLANFVAHVTAEKMAGDLKGLQGGSAALAILQLTPKTAADLLPAMQQGLAQARAFLPG